MPAGAATTPSERAFGPAPTVTVCGTTGVALTMALGGEGLAAGVLADGVLADWGMSRPPQADSARPSITVVITRITALVTPR
jgi:hypothetical protein